MKIKTTKVEFTVTMTPDEMDVLYMVMGEITGAELIALGGSQEQVLLISPMYDLFKEKLEQ